MMEEVGHGHPLWLFSTKWQCPNPQSSLVTWETWEQRVAWVFPYWSSFDISTRWFHTYPLRNKSTSCERFCLLCRPRPSSVWASCEMALRYGQHWTVFAKVSPKLLPWLILKWGKDVTFSDNFSQSGNGCSCYTYSEQTQAQALLFLLWPGNLWLCCDLLLQPLLLTNSNVTASVQFTLFS